MACHGLPNSRSAIFIYKIIVNIIEGSLEVKLPTIWTVEKQRGDESEETRSEERRCRSLCFSNDLWLRRVEK
jgi:hypothetical protein